MEADDHGVMCINGCDRPAVYQLPNGVVMDGDDFIPVYDLHCGYDNCGEVA